MNKFERWFLKRIIKREVRQGYDHAAKHVALYQMIRDAHRAEFTEDNAVTADDFLQEQFEKTQSQNLFGILRR
jgi:hypothetical protein